MSYPISEVLDIEVWKELKENLYRNSVDLTCEMRVKFDNMALLGAVW